MKMKGKNKKKMWNKNYFGFKMKTKMKKIII